jgi:hypothetical protein
VGGDDGGGIGDIGPHDGGSPALDGGPGPIH